MKTKNKITIGIFVSILVLPTVIWFLLMLLNPKFTDKLDSGLGENRKKAEIKWDELIHSGNSVIDYYSDRVPFRSLAVSAYQKMEGNIEKIYRDSVQPFILNAFYKESEKDENSQLVADVDDLHDNSQMITDKPQTEEKPSEETENVHKHDYKVVSTVEATTSNYGYTEYKCSTCSNQYKDDYVNKLIDISYFPPKVYGNGALQGRDNWLFYTGNDSIEYYKGSNLLSQKTLDNYLEKVKTLKNLCDQKGKELCLFFMPNKEQVYNEYMPTYTIENDYKRTQRLVDYISSNSDAKVIYPIKELEMADIYWQVYYRYDTHWNQMGAFVGLNAMYSKLGKEVTNLQELCVTKIPATDRNDLITMGGLELSNYPQDYDYTFEYRNNIKIISRTSSDYGANGVFRSESDSTDKRHITFIGDSYRVAMVPYMERDFAKCTIIHRDNTGAAIEDIKNSDIIVLSAVERYDDRLFKNMDRVIEILK